jgi:hypothetical protein
MKTIRIGNGQGFWGDNIDAPVNLLREGPIDYVGMDYLAEVTLSIMMRQKLKNPQLGYATDFIQFMRRVLPELKENSTKVIANAGGLNPLGCREEILKICQELGLQGMQVGVVEGDDLHPRLSELIAAGHSMSNMETGEPMSHVVDRVTSANAYLGAWPIVEALNQGAQIVVCGRVTDTALTLAPMIHEFGWGAEEWDLLSAGTIAGHIVECGAQCTGGNFSRWWEVPDLWNVGYPIIEAREDGSFVVTKHQGTGGMVTCDTVAEQLLYEMGNPEQYIGPDVVADFTSIQLEDEAPNRVRVWGIRGSEKTSTLKISASFLQGFKATGQVTISGPRAIEKANLAAEIVWKRLERAGVAFDQEQKTEELVGVDGCLPGILEAPTDPPEVILRLGVQDDDRGKIERFGKEIAPLITAGPPGVTGFAGGRPKPQEVVAYWPALLDRDLVEQGIRVTVEEA